MNRSAFFAAIRDTPFHGSLSQSQVDGMIRGWFTGRKLLDYIDGDRRDYVNARRIINGTDRAQVIAGYAMAFERALRAATLSNVERDSPKVENGSPLPPSLPPWQPDDPGIDLPDDPQPALSGLFDAMVAFFRAIFSRKD